MPALEPPTGSVDWLKQFRDADKDTPPSRPARPDESLGLGLDGVSVGSRQWMADQMTAHFEELQTVRAAGQEEYAHDEDDAFANFRRLGKSLGLSKEKVLLVYAQKHLDGIYAHVNGHVYQREPVQGRIKDLITYLHLLWGMIDAK